MGADGADASPEAVELQNLIGHKSRGETHHPFAASARRCTGEPQARRHLLFAWDSAQGALRWLTGLVAVPSGELGPQKFDSRRGCPDEQTPPVAGSDADAAFTRVKGCFDSLLG